MIFKHYLARAITSLSVEATSTTIAITATRSVVYLAS